MKKFITRAYKISTEKIKKGTAVKFAVLADQHGLVFGESNRELYQAIKNENPDAVLIAGDMICSSNVETLTAAEEFLSVLSESFPVFYSLGNHEYRLLEDPLMKREYLRYERMLTQAGVCFLHNEHVAARIGENEVVFYGLELPLEFYRKPKAPYFSIKDMDALLGTPSRDGIRVLLAHNPAYGRTYFSWGSDVIFSGHYHGGVLRFSENHGLISPQFHLFPAFCCGHFRKGRKHMIVSAGLGEHTIPVRLHNPRELVIAELVHGE